MLFSTFSFFVSLGDATVTPPRLLRSPTTTIDFSHGHACIIKFRRRLAFGNDDNRRCNAVQLIAPVGRGYRHGLVSYSTVAGPTLTAPTGRPSIGRSLAVHGVDRFRPKLEPLVCFMSGHRAPDPANGIHGFQSKPIVRRTSVDLSTTHPDPMGRSRSRGHGAWPWTWEPANPEPFKTTWAETDRRAKMGFPKDPDIQDRQDNQ